jgi:adenine-specific DNA-methyltransferase
MNEARQILEKIINDFAVEKFVRFFREKSRSFAERQEDLTQYNHDNFTNGKKLGEMTFPEDDRLIVCAFEVKTPLSERSGKKAQYEQAKSLLKTIQSFSAGIFIFYDQDANFRFSLIYPESIGNKRQWNNFRRFTYYVSKDQTNKTFCIRVGEGDFSTLDLIKDAFSVEKVNKEFYKQIAEYYYRLTGKDGYKKELVLPSVREDDIKKYEEFAVRLIGRIIFCWFLKHKKSAGDTPTPLIPKEALSVSAVQSHKDYYHSILEPLFFEVMNKPSTDRKTVAVPQSDKIPFLNGGLFEPHGNDYYENMANYALKIPDRWFEDFLSVLEQYNFTIDENSTVDAEVSVDPEMLGRIFENLLAEVVPETGETARKATGSYYTPRAIVDYMVEQSLKQYLRTRTKLPEVRLDSLLSYEDNRVELTVNERDGVITALKEIKVIDPACGSGAFPIGILHRMLMVLEKVDPTLEIWKRLYLSSYHPVMRKIIEDKLRKGNEQYIRKLTIIQDSIYGVDIQPIAVEIAKLRCFLSLVVDELVLDNEENRGIEPLPNLEFKFVSANTLIGLPPRVEAQGAFGASEAIMKLKELRDSYLRSFGTEKVHIEKEFRATQQKLFKENVEWAVSDTLVRQLTDWDPFSYKSCGWFDPGWMFGIEGGFDVVIANPPYIKEYVNRTAFDGVRGSSYYKGKMDIWYLFASISIDNLKDDGILTFIAQNNWVTSYGASKLRHKVVSDTRIVALLDFGDYMIFETSGIQTMVMVFRKDQKTDNYTFDYRRAIGDKVEFEDILDLLNYRVNSNTEYLTPKIQRGKFYDTTLTFSHSIIEKVIEKIHSKANLYLKESEVANGIHHHHDVVNRERQQILGNEFEIGDGIFVLSDKEKRNMPFSKNELALIKPSYTTKELHKWYGNPKNKEWVIYTDSSFKDTQNIKPYPNIKRHLDKFREVITSDNWPYGLHRARDERFFKGEKIIAVRKCIEPTFTYTDFDCYVSATFYIIKTERINLKYLTAILNSKLIAFWLKNKGKMQGNNYQIDKEPLLAIPIYKPSNQEQQSIVPLVDQILVTTKGDDYLDNPTKQAKVKTLEHQIDQLVYALYGLTSEEIAVVEGSQA